ncbi:MAG TPA: hypothetical protein VLC09_19190 [Polyangiaceae bacterium]|nr:hypothetical protein [Polyangiaceae bacterium]
MTSFSAKPLVSALLAAGLALGCASARLEPADATQKVPNKPKAASITTDIGVMFQAEADSWVADERVRDEVTAMKITLANHGEKPVNVDYNAFELVADDGSSFRPVPPESIEIRGATRSIGLPADTIITRSSDSSVNAPNRTESEKQQIRQRLVEQALDTAPLAPGQRVVGFVYFQRVPASKTQITLKGRVLAPESGEPAASAELSFQARAEH